MLHDIYIAWQFCVGMTKKFGFHMWELKNEKINIKKYKGFDMETSPRTFILQIWLVKPKVTYQNQL